jgi:hypothetical protein
MMTELQMLREMERLFLLALDTKFLTQQQKDQLDTDFQEMLLHLRTYASSRSNNKAILALMKWRNIK